MSYTALTGFRTATGFRRLPRSEWGDLDGLRTAGLQAVFSYPDAQTDDRLLTQAVMASARSLGAELACPARFVHGTIAQDHCELVIDGPHELRRVHCAAIVNAAGPWANDVLARIRPPQPLEPVELVQGTHLEIPGKITRGCYYCEAPSDGRAVFVMPWKDRTLVGTTEHVYRGDPADVVPLPEEIDYLSKTLIDFFPARTAAPVAMWSGLRVLPASDRVLAFRRSRETHFATDRASQPHLLSIFGGKLTTYRATSERVIRQLGPSLPKRQPQARTSELPLTADAGRDFGAE
jgi:glycerol-3-phosphate dehydrogenase